MLNQVALSTLKNDRTDGVVNDFLTLEKASSCEGDHKNSFLVLKSGLSGDNREAIVSVLEDNWFTNTIKDCRSLRLVDVGH